jgi:hypothetical protein
VSVSYSAILFLVLNIKQDEEDILQYIVIGACLMGMGISLGFFILQVLGTIIRVIKRCRRRRVVKHMNDKERNNELSVIIDDSNQNRESSEISKQADTANICSRYGMLNETLEEI